MIFVKPATGRFIAMPDRGWQVMPTSGAHVRRDGYYQRLIRAKDLIEVAPQASMPSDETEVAEQPKTEINSMKKILIDALQADGLSEADADRHVQTVLDTISEQLESEGTFELHDIGVLSTFNRKGKKYKLKGKEGVGQSYVDVRFRDSIVLRRRLNPELDVD